MSRLLAVRAVVLACTSCNDRLPLTHLEASAAARNWCIHEVLPWGDPVIVTGPGPEDADKRLWYTVRFAAPKDGPPRVLLVNSASGWVKRAP